MKARSMACADVVQADEFLSMSIEAMLLYFLILFHADVCGRIYGASRICRGYGFDADTLQELYDNGYLLRVGGLTVDAHCWRNNKLDARLKTRMDSWEAFTSGRIAFEGEPFKSSYVLSDVAATEERRDNDGGTAPNTTQRQSQSNVNDNPNPTERQSQQHHQSQSVLRIGTDAKPEGAEGQETHPCQCPTCRGTEAQYWQDAEGTHIACASCGTFLYDNRR